MFGQQQPAGGAAAGIFGQPAVPAPAPGLGGLGMFGKPQHQPQPQPAAPAPAAAFGVFGKPVPSSPAAPTPISSPGGGPAFDSFVLTLDESDAVRVAVEDAKNDPDEVARLRPTANVMAKVSGIIRNSAPPLFLACSRDGGDLKKAALLLLAGADIDGSDSAGYVTPLHRASLDGMVDHVRLLLAWGGADLHAKGGFGGITPLQSAIDRGQVEVARLLREAGAVE